jgi:predicted KAP-like P-loop ATPase
MDMWADIDTDTDYLNYREVAEVVAELLLDPGMRPVSIGIFGTWGTGKSTLLNLIDGELQTRAAKQIIVIRFDAWLYQGYDDARAALMDVIARTLYDAAKANESWSKIALRLLGRVNTMRTLGYAIEAVAAAHGIPMFGAGAKAVNALGQFVKGTPDENDAEAMAAGGKAALSLIDPERKKSPPEEIEAFRADFEDLLTKLDKTLVVFVDNLDRCLPAQTIHTLEALRLFLFMDQTAFVVAADDDMVKQSVAQHFRDADERHVTDYLDKLIQIPVRVPRLGVTEVRAYLCLLFAEASGIEQDAKDRLRDHLDRNLRDSWKDAPLSIDTMVAIVGDGGERLRTSFDTADRMADMLTASALVSGNPRIVKRMLNVVRLRSRIAIRREMQVSEELVTKFALFERCLEPTAVAKLYALINEAPKGKPDLISQLEALIEDEERFTTLLPEAWIKHSAFLLNWFSLKPTLAGVDLRSLVYLGRETVALRARAPGLSEAAEKAATRLGRVASLASPAGRNAIQSIPAGEHANVMRELIGRLRSHADWAARPEEFTGAMLLAQADAAAGARLKAFIQQLPKRSVWLTAAVRAEAWFKEQR